MKLIKLSDYAKQIGCSVRTLYRRIDDGSLNILKKVVGNFDYDPIEVCSTPSVYTVKFN